MSRYCRGTRSAVVVASIIATVAFGDCFGDEQVKTGKIDLYPTYSAVGIEVAYTGDEDGSCTAEFAWRVKGADKWRNGVDMTYDRKRGLAWGSIWPLEEGQTIETRVVIKDGGKELPALEAAAATRKLITEVKDGTTYYVSPAGDDAGAGTKDKPFRTLGRAAKAAKAGDTICAMTGVYNEGGLFAGLGGTAEKPIIIKAADGEKPVIDGSSVVESGKDVWMKHDEGVYVLETPPVERPIGYVAADGMRMYRYRSLESLAGNMSENGQKVPRAWFFDGENKKLYVTFADGSDPNAYTFNLATENYGAVFEDSKYVVVKGFEIRNFSSGGVMICGAAEGCTVTDSVIHNVPAGVQFEGGKTANCAVLDNEIYERGLTDFSWNAIKASEYPRQGIIGIGGRGSSICRNRIHGFFDGIAPVSWQHPDDLELNRDMDIMYNTIYNVGDDAIEVDGGGVNMRIHGNRIRNAFAAISLAPIERGPVYCTRNDSTYYLLNFKLNVGGCTSLGWTYCYHNSSYCLTRGRQYGGSAISFPTPETIPIANKVFKNNAFLCDELGVRYGQESYEIDYNCYYNVPGETVIFTWSTQDPDGSWEKNEYATLEDFSKATGRETRGLYADPRFSSTPSAGEIERVDYGPAPFGGYPQLTDASSGDTALQKDSPCIDAGVVIRGVNEDFEGKAPDMGAHEYKAAPPSK